MNPKEFKEKMGLSTEEAAKMLKYSPQQYVHWLNGGGTSAAAVRLMDAIVWCKDNGLLSAMWTEIRPVTDLETWRKGMRKTHEYTSRVLGVSIGTYGQWEWRKRSVSQSVMLLVSIIDWMYLTWRIGPFIQHLVDAGRFRMFSK